jgi:hypothetical protein
MDGSKTKNCDSLIGLLKKKDVLSLVMRKNVFIGKMTLATHRNGRLSASLVG